MENKNNFYMLIDDVFDITDRGPVATGTIESGFIKVGDEVKITGMGKSHIAIVVGIEMFRKILNQGEEGDNVGLILCGVSKNDIKHGMMMRLADTDVTFSKSKTPSSSNSESSTVTTNDSTSNMNIDKSKIEYVIGIDLGHGETSAAYCSLQWNEGINQLQAPKDIELSGGGNRAKVIPSAISVTNDGQVIIGESAFNSDILQKAKVNVCFKRKPQDINGEAEMLMILYMEAVYRLIREKLSGILTDSNHLVFIATPSGWEDKDQKLYWEMAKKAGIPIPKGGVTRESKAAFIRAQSDPSTKLGQNVQKGALIVDLGSSTLDLSYYNASLSKPINFGYDCGASAIERAMYSAKLANQDIVKQFIGKYPLLNDALLFKMRELKEHVFVSTSPKTSKTIDFENIVDDDEDFYDESVKVKYRKGEIDEFLEEIGYVKVLRDKISDFVENHISGKPVYGAYLTGGAARMDFVKHIVAECLAIPDEKVIMDSDPSLTISQGVAEEGRRVLRIGDSDKKLALMFSKVSGDAIYSHFAEELSEKLLDEVSEAVSDTIEEWANSSWNSSLNDLNDLIEESVENVIDECTSDINVILYKAIEEETLSIRKEVDVIVEAYTSERTKIAVPLLKDLGISGEFDFDMSDVIREVSCLLQNKSFRWSDVASATGIAIAVGSILGGPLGLFIGGGTLVYKTFFGEEETESQKNARVMSEILDEENRSRVLNDLKAKWDEVYDSIDEAITDSISDNTRLRKKVSSSVDNLLTAYKEALTKARIMIE